METLYRKYRSQTFAELVGQAQAKQILRNAIRRGRLSHAYLFCGPRGTGKTSVARIFAKALCCLTPNEGDCCAKCANCLQVAAGQALDVIEMDAASNRGIDAMRDLRERVGYAPASFPYKVYIIDEVHMVTREAFNALLKTLEEPPPHVKFLLCTTEAHKLPVTILSRCLRLDFTRIALPELAAHLQWISGQEGFTLSDSAALELSSLAEGSARDAISLLDQLTVFCDGSIELSHVRDLFQLGDRDLVGSIVKSLAANKQRELLDSWERMAGQGADAQRFLLQVAEAVKECYVETGDPAWRSALEVLWQGLNLMKQESFPALLVELSLLQAASSYAETSQAGGATEDRGAAPLSDASGARSAGSGVRASMPAELRRSFNRQGVTPREDVAVSFHPSGTTSGASSAVEMHSSVGVTANTDPHLARFLAALRDLSLPAFVLTAPFARASLNEATLELGFEASLPWSRQALAHLRVPELMDKVELAARQVYSTTQLRTGLLGEEASWQQSGTSQEASAAASKSPKPGSATSADKAQALFQRMATSSIATGQAEDMNQTAGPGAGYVQDLEAAMGRSMSSESPDDLGRELAAVPPKVGNEVSYPDHEPGSGSVTVEEVIELFGARVISEEP